jgi:hypothetical protein
MKYFILFLFIGLALGKKDVTVRPFDCYYDTPPFPADYITNNSDDQIEIQKAIDSVSKAGGGTVILWACDFTLSDRLVMKSNVNIRGSHEADYYSSFNYNGKKNIDSLIVFENVKDIVVHRLDLANLKQIHNYAVKITKSSNIKLTNMRIDTKYTGFKVLDSSNIKIVCSPVRNSQIGVDITRVNSLDIGCTETNNADYCICSDFFDLDDPFQHNSYTNNAVVFQSKDSNKFNIYGYRVGIKSDNKIIMKVI